MKEICFVGLGGYSAFMTVDHFNAIGETVSAQSFFAEPGGKGYNQAVAAARLGSACSFVGAFGKDDTADICMDFLKNEGIKAVPVYKNTSSAYACILTDKHGENRVTVYGGAASQLNGKDIKDVEAHIKAASMIVLQNEVQFSANEAVFEIAKKHSIPVVVNPAPAVNYDIQLLKKAFVITPNEHEAKSIFGEDWQAGMKRENIKQAVVTLGSKGCAVYDNGKVVYIQGKPAKVVDTTGAGDCFTAALCVKLNSGYNLFEAAEYANKAASVAVSGRFAVKAMPYVSQIM